MTQRLSQSSAQPQLQWLVDWFFERYVYVLTSTPWKVVWRKIHNKHGETDWDAHTITLSTARKNVNANQRIVFETLVHELAHVVFGYQTTEIHGVVPHVAIDKFDKIAAHFTARQRAILLAAIPPRPKATRVPKE